MIDEFLVDFLPYNVRKKLYSAFALINVLLVTVSASLTADGIIQEKLSAYPVTLMVIGAVGAIITLLAKANADPDDPADEGAVIEIEDDDEDENSNDIDIIELVEAFSKIETGVENYVGKHVLEDHQGEG